MAKLRAAVAASGFGMKATESRFIVFTKLSAIPFIWMPTPSEALRVQVRAAPGSGFSVQRKAPSSRGRASNVNEQASVSNTTTTGLIKHCAGGLCEKIFSEHFP